MAAVLGSTQDFPIIDMGAPDAAEAICEALTNVGFLIVKNHGVDEAVLEKGWNATAEWFARPRDEKLKAPAMGPDYAYGYSPVRGELLSAGAEDGNRALTGAAADVVLRPDEKEMWTVGPTGYDGSPDRRWPDNAEGLRLALEGYYDAMSDLAERLLAKFAQALNLDDEAWFEKFTRKHASALRTISYPPLSTALEPGQTRASAHTDYGAVTILRSGGPGLQVLNREDVWVDVPDMDESSFIVNLGDLMSRWTNGRWLSTPHRVIVPDEGKTDAESGAPVVAKARQSIAFFHNMDMDASIETIPTCLAADGTSKYPPILAGDHLMKKHNAATQGQLLNVYA